MATPIKQESCTEDVKPCITSLNSIANLPMKTEDGSISNPTPNNLPMKNEEGSNTNPTPNNNEEYRNGDVRKRNFTENVEEEIGKRMDLNLRLTPLGSRLKDCLSSNRCPEISSVSISTSSCMPVNNQNSSSEEVEFSDTTPELPSLIVMGCSNCYMYVMVSEAEPRCPRCNTSDLIDIFRPVGKKSKKF